MSTFLTFILNTFLSIHKKHILLELQFQLMICVQLNFVLPFETLPRQSVCFPWSTCANMFCDTSLLFLLIKVREIQWIEFFLSIVKKLAGQFLPKDCSNARRLISFHLVNYASSLTIFRKEPTAPFYALPGIFCSELRMWDIKFNRSYLTYYKN